MKPNEICNRQDRVIEDVTCTPLQASILMKFADVATWTAPKLAAALGAPPIV